MSLGEKPILGFGDVHGPRAFFVIVRNVINPGAHGVTAQTPMGVLGKPRQEEASPSLSKAVKPHYSQRVPVHNPFAFGETRGGHSHCIGHG